MTEYTCNFCDKIFASKYNLNKHQKTAKFCLDVQNEKYNESDKKSNFKQYKCEYCNKECYRKDSLLKHLSVCNEKKVAIASDELEKYKIKYNELKSSHNNLKNNLANINIEIEQLKVYKELYLEAKSKNVILEEQLKENEQYKIFKELYNELKIKNEKLEEELKLKNEKLEDELKFLASKAIDKAGNTINTTNNKNQYYNQLLPLTQDYMNDQRQFLTFNNVKNGAHGLAHFASNHTFKDRLFCSDKSRLNFVFKNENDVIIKDPEGIEITKKFIEINREELLRLVEEYLNYITIELMKDIGNDMYKFWAEKREEFISIRSAVLKGNVCENKESYSEFKRNFLLALSNLVPR